MKLGLERWFHAKEHLGLRIQAKCQMRLYPCVHPSTAQGGDRRHTGDWLACGLVTGSERPYLKGVRQRMVEQDTNIFL